MEPVAHGADTFTPSGAEIAPCVVQGSTAEDPMRPRSKKRTDRVNCVPSVKYCTHFIWSGIYGLAETAYLYCVRTV